MTSGRWQVFPLSLLFLALRIPRRTAEVSCRILPTMGLFNDLSHTELRLWVGGRTITEVKLPSLHHIGGKWQAHYATGEGHLHPLLHVMWASFSTSEYRIRNLVAFIAIISRLFFFPYLKSYSSCVFLQLCIISIIKNLKVSNEVDEVV